MKTLAAIQAEIARLQEKADLIRKQEVAGVIERICTAIDHYGLTAADLGFGSIGAATKAKPGPSAKSTAPTAGGTVGVAKYRDPATGKTWTGRGKPPAWIAGVANRDEFLIAGGDAPTAAKSPSAKGASAKGAKTKSAPAKSGTAKSTTIGIAKYRDPASGKTWTGRGTPPAWIAGASDRATFLISAQSA